MYMDYNVFSKKDTILTSISGDSIDVVYTWAGINTENNVRNRYNYELEYSLKTVLKYMPWVNKIYILINRDVKVPPKLCSSPKIQFVNRSDLFENQAYSITMNTFAVYSILDKIPGLSEHIIILDDDFFCVSEHGKEYYFDQEKRPIVRFPRRRVKIYPDKLFDTV